MVCEKSVCERWDGICGFTQSFDRYSADPKVVMARKMTNSGVGVVNTRVTGGESG